MARSLVVLTGAGVSQESGLATFRDQNGLWENHPVEKVASPEGFEADPGLVHRFYNLRRAQLLTVQPNRAHEALARLEREWPGEFLLVSQNVDDLHQRAGSRRLLSMHGELRKGRCVACGWVGRWDHDMSQATICPGCQAVGKMRPHIVWFGEVPFGLEEAFEALGRADIFIAAGTSGQVYPAAGFVRHVPRNCWKIECNSAGTGISKVFDERREGPAAQTIPDLVSELLAQALMREKQKR